MDTQYREDAWTVRQVVHHVLDSHVNAYVRFRWALTGAAALVSVLSLSLGACASSGSIPLVEGVPDLPLVTRTGTQPGDQVTIAFYTAAGTRLAEVSGERDVDSNGEAFLPFLGTVSVVGLETAEIRRLLEDRYGVLYSNPVV